MWRLCREGHPEPIGLSSWPWQPTAVTDSVSSHGTPKGNGIHSRELLVFPEEFIDISAKLMALNNTIIIDIRVYLLISACTH